MCGNNPQIAWILWRIKHTQLFIQAIQTLIYFRRSFSNFKISVSYKAFQNETRLVLHSKTLLN